MSKVDTENIDYSMFDEQVLLDQLGYTKEKMDKENKWVIRNKKGNPVGGITSRDEEDTCDVDYVFEGAKTKTTFEIVIGSADGCIIRMENSKFGSYTLECNSLGEVVITHNYIGRKIEANENAQYSLNAEDGTEEYAYNIEYVDRKKSTDNGFLQGKRGYASELLYIWVKDPNSGVCFTQPAVATLEWYVKTMALSFNRVIKREFPNINLIKLVIGSELYEKMGLANLFGYDKKAGNVLKKVSSDEE